MLKIQQLDLLAKLYENIIVPEAVWQEVEVGKDGSFYADLTSFAWISIQEIQKREGLDYLTDLDKGEAEVIVLAREIDADLVIIDEILGRQYAEHFGLTLTGTIGILLRAKKEGHVHALRPLLEQLQSNGVWLSNNVIKEVLILAGE